MSSKSVIFDLDGTLVDSQDSILNGIRSALDEFGLKAKIPLSRMLVGPPLVETLERITDIKNQEKINKVAHAFKLYYDSVGYIDSSPYPGIQYLLESLVQHNYVLYLATNKRQIPTDKILDHHSWRHFFSAIYCIDLNIAMPFKNKTEMISALLIDQQINPEMTVYVGDKLEDYEAAKLNGLSCALVGWGYGENLSSNGVKSWHNADNPVELQSIIQRLL